VEVNHPYRWKWKQNFDSSSGFSRSMQQRINGKVVIPIKIRCNNWLLMGIFYLKIGVQDQDAVPNAGPR